MLAAVARGRCNVVSSLLATGTDPDYSERGGDPALLTALEYGHIQVAALLLREGADVNVQGSSAKTPLHKAVLLGRPDYVQFLVQRGASTETRDLQGRTPLLLAVEKQQADCARALARLGADVNAATKVFRMTPLILAAERGYADVVRVLLNHGAQLNQTDMRGFTALHAAVLASVVRITQMLLSAGADPNIVDEDGMSALMFSVYRNRPLIAKVLIQHNCAVDLNTDLRFLAHLSDQAVRFSAVQLAVAFRRRETAALLLASGCDTRNIDAFLQLRLPYVTPDRTRSMLRGAQKVQRVSTRTGAAGSVAPISVSPGEAKEDQAWVALLHRARHTPPALSTRTRAVIRACMSHVNFERDLHRLPLPKPLRDFLMMTEF